jgi:hypothetical protein
LTGPLKPSGLPFAYNHSLAISRLSQLDARWTRKGLERTHFKFTFGEVDASICQFELLGSELYIVKSIRRQASCEMTMIDVEREALLERQIYLEGLAEAQKKTAAINAAIYGVECTLHAMATTKKLLAGFYHLTGDIQKLALPARND